MPAVHRHGDPRTCGASTIVSGQSTVFIGGQLAAVQNDQNTHGGGQLNASVNPGTVFIEGKLVVAVGSSAQPDRALHVNPAAASGSGDVFLG